MVTTISFPVCQRFPDILQNWRDCEHGRIANSIVLLVEKPEETILVQMWNGFGMQCKWTLHCTVGVKFEKYCNMLIIKNDTCEEV